MILKQIKFINLFYLYINFNFGKDLIMAFRMSQTIYNPSEHKWRT